MKKENRHVLLLIDNAGGHSISLELKKYTLFKYFFFNTWKKSFPKINPGMALRISSKRQTSETLATRFVRYFFLP